MDGFLAVNGNSYKIKKDKNSLEEYQIKYFTAAQKETRAVWHVGVDPQIVREGKRPGESHHAMILAIEAFPGNTIVEFVDGRIYQRDVDLYGKSSYPEPTYTGEAYLATHKPIGNDFIKISEWIKNGLNKNQPPSKLTNELETKVKSKRGRRNPNLDTPRKLKKLVSIREDAIKRKIDIPAWSTACKLAGIDHKTAINYLRDLRENWDARDYHWSGDFGESGESGEF